MEYELKVVSYTECRKEYFENLLSSAKRRLTYWTVQHKLNDSYLGKPHRKCCEIADEICYLTDAIKALEAYDAGSTATNKQNC